MTELAGGAAPPLDPALWLGMLQRLAGRAAHEVKNSLNGVAVNLEVVRSRSARPGATAESVSRFAEAASEQLERLTAQTEALLALMRPPREQCDVALVARALEVLVGGLLVGGSESPVFVVEGAGSAPTAARPELVRLVLGEIALAAIEGASPVRLAVVAEDGRVEVVVRGEHGPPSALTPATRALADGGNVRTARRDEALVLVLPAAGES